MNENKYKSHLTPCVRKALKHSTSSLLLKMI